MTAIEAHAPTIAIRERYHDAVSDRWPVTVTPQPDELLSSWLHRLAYANGVPPRAFARVLGRNSLMWSASLDLRLPSDIANLLSANTGIAPNELAAMMLRHALPRRLLLPLRNSGHRTDSTWLQFCSRCLAEDAQPYFRRRWRLATRVSCMEHSCRLRDRCPSCHGGIAAFDQAELLPQHYCARCGYDLRRASRIGISPAARRLDRCIDDICRLEGMRDSPSSRSLIRRLLNTHEGIYSTPNLTDLSTAARARCIAYAAKHEDDWLTAGDESAAAQWRCLILAAEGHGPLIERLTECLAKRRELKELRELQAKTIVQPQRVELVALLGAYARVMEGGRRRRPNLRGAGPDLSPG
ncbi:TniQ family protein [Agrobacterium vitis]|uniref:TniQ family protein n=1 Tax=Agrobacterium vitis TaxID=373 RepID=UPI001572F6C1|nr:TniQ family protein [Agrobacterium vitis]NSZ19805.1 TniQ family protein [Agrobacterium vitis]QZO07100.1 TniQ family protein [Agrobacterium vitis]UJL91195.1 TniQ family protein [Agrobacterium vitis]